jgi:hypothetical protein
MIYGYNKLQLQFNSFGPTGTYMSHRHLSYVSWDLCDSQMNAIKPLQSFVPVMNLASKRQANANIKPQQSNFKCV